MSAAGVVVGVDVGEEFDLGVGGVDEAAVLQHLRFQGAHEGFGPNIVIGISPRGHASADVGLLKKPPVFTAAILAAAVAVEDEAFGCGTGAEGLTEGIANEGGSEVAGEGPADDAPGAKIDHHGQIEPAFASGSVGDVAGLYGVGGLGERLIQQQIEGGAVRPPIAGFGHEAAGLNGLESPFPHDPADAFGGAGEAHGGQFGGDSPVTVATAMLPEDGFNSGSEFLIRTLRSGGFSGMVVAAARHFQHGADDPEGVAGGLADGVHHFPELDGSLVPRMTAAFFKMSFSIWRWALSRRRSRRSSASDLSPPARGHTLPTCGIRVPARQL